VNGVWRCGVCNESKEEFVVASDSQYTYGKMTLVCRACEEDLIGPEMSELESKGQQRMFTEILYNHRIEGGECDD